MSHIVPTKQILTVIHADHSFKITMQFYHVSGEYFLIDWDSLVNPGCFAKSRRPALFRIGSDGVVKSVGIRMEDGMRGEWEEQLIWFERVV
jgi:delta-aminolevulinic acid dehydratase/porphobilinogen synthase